MIFYNLRNSNKQLQKFTPIIKTNIYYMIAWRTMRTKTVPLHLKIVILVFKID